MTGGGSPPEPSPDPDGPGARPDPLRFPFGETRDPSGDGQDPETSGDIPLPPNWDKETWERGLERPLDLVGEEDANTNLVDEGFAEAQGFIPLEDVSDSDLRDALPRPLARPRGGDFIPIEGLESGSQDDPIGLDDSEPRPFPDPSAQVQRRSGSVFDGVVRGCESDEDPIVVDFGSVSGEFAPGVSQSRFRDRDSLDDPIVVDFSEESQGGDSLRFQASIIDGSARLAGAASTVGPAYDEDSFEAISGGDSLQSESEVSQLHPLAEEDAPDVLAASGDVRASSLDEPVPDIEGFASEPALDMRSAQVIAPGSEDLRGAYAALQRELREARKDAAAREDEARRARRRALLLLILLLLLLLILGGLAWAWREAQGQAERERLAASAAQDKLASIDARLASLQADFEARQRIADEARAERDRLRQELEAQRQDAEAQRRAAEARLASARDEGQRELEEALAAERRRTRELEAELREARAEPLAPDPEALRELEAAEREARERAEALGEALAAAERRVSAAEEALAEAQGELSEARAAAREDSAAVAALASNRRGSGAGGAGGDDGWGGDDWGDEGGAGGDDGWGDEGGDDGWGDEGWGEEDEGWGGDDWGDDSAGWAGSETEVEELQRHPVVEAWAWIQENIHGFVAYKNLTHKDDENPIGQDLRQTRHELRSQLEYKGPLAGPISLYSEVELRLDDDEYTNRLVQDIRNRSERRAKVNFDELYLLYPVGPLDIRVGFQTIAWGTGDLQNPTDNINPKDLSDLFDSKKQGVLALRLNYYLADFNLEGILIPFFTPTRVPPTGKRFAPAFAPISVPLGPVVVTPRFAAEREFPEDSEEAQFGFRLSRSFLGWDVSVSYYDGFNKVPLARVEAFEGPSATPGIPDILVRSTLFYEKIRVFGADFATTLAWADVGGELGDIFRKTQIHGELAYVESVDVTGDDYVQYVLGFNYTFNDVILDHDIVLLVDYLDEVILDKRQEFGIERLTAGLSPGVQQLVGPFLPQARAVVEERAELQRGYRGSVSARLSYEFSDTFELVGTTVFVLRGEENLYLQTKFVWDVTDNLRLEAGTDYFEGPRDSFFGQYRDNDRLFVLTRVSF